MDLMAGHTLIFKELKVKRFLLENEKLYSS